MNELLPLLGTLIGFRTVVPDNREKEKCLQWIEKNFLTQSGLPVMRGDVNGAPFILLTHPEPRLLWFAHIDVVPGSDEQFSVTVDGDTAFGRGVKDMKGAALVFLMAYRDFCAAGAVPPVSILVTSDEETGGKTPAAIVEKGLCEAIPVAFTPDTGAAPGIVTELKGAAWAHLIAGGRGGHGSLPWEADNPVPRLSEALTIIGKHFSASREVWDITVTPTELGGSTAFNIIPDEARATLDIRFPKESFASPEEAIAAVENILPDGCRLEGKVSAVPMSTDRGHPMVRLFQRIGEEVTGKPVEFRREHGSSDARTFAQHGIPAFLYGPDGGDLHGKREWVSLRSLQQHYQINKRVLDELRRGSAK